MREVIYIEPSEEITSIVNKIKIQRSEDIFLVIPEDAVLVKGIINLEILKREAEKRGKKITFATNNAHVRKILQDLNLKVADNYNLIGKRDPLQKTEKPLLEKAARETVKQLDNLDNQKKIGSSSYYTDQEQQLAKKREGDTIDKAINKRAKQRPKKEGGRSFRSMFKEKEAEKFFSDPAEQENLKAKKNFKKTKKRLKYFVFTACFLIFLVGAGSWIYLNWPKVEIEIYPRFKAIEENTDFKIIYGDKKEDKLAASDEILGELKELEIEEKFSFEATGEKFSSDKGKARGTVKIINHYSSAAQPLVATTRVLSEEGKLFRLINGVTVPGMEGEEPGEVEVKVIADQPGADYNIEPASFTIEGFKGGPKYEKFEVISEEKMAGGSDEIKNNKVKYVTESDIDQARKESVDLLNKALEEKIQKKIGENRNFLLDSIEKEIISSRSSLQAGEMGENFDFTIKERIRAITFNQEDLKSLLYLKILKDASAGYKLDSDSIRINYVDNLDDKEKKQLDVEIEVSGLMWPEIDIENIKIGIEGKKEEEIKKVLENYSEIKKASIEFYPSYFKMIPVTKEKISIKQIRES